MLRAFRTSLLLTFLGLGIGFWYGGIAGGIAVAVLLVLEISLSFDNAVVNAKVLTKMSMFWRKIFLTVGILIAVVGMRLLLPILLVAVTAGLGFVEVIDLALNNPEEYSHHLEESEEAIYAFGGTFLLMIFLDFVLDPERDIHWLAPIERRLSKVGNLKTLPVVIALASIYTSYTLAEPEKGNTVLVSGLAGLFTYLLISGINDLMENNEPEGVENEETGKKNNPALLVGKAGLFAFLYLEILDASFSFDGVIGASAISNDIVVIAIGLGVGAYWVRSMTIYLVEKGTLAEFVYLEHGAHWAIGVLAVIMLAEVKYHISEYITGISGVLFIVAAVISSIIEKRRQEHAAVTV